MEVIQRQGGKLPTCFFETENKSVIYCLMNPEHLRPQSEVISIEDSDDVSIIENRKGLLKMKDIFPCAVSTGCNKSPNVGEPEHMLRCLIVKILKEFRTPNIHIEQLCTILSKRYKYFYNMPPYTLVRRIKDAINNSEDFLKIYKIVLNEKEHCVLLPDKDEVILLDSEDEDDVKREIKLEYDAMVKKESSDSLKIVAVESMVTDDDGISQVINIRSDDDLEVPREEDLMDEAPLVIDENPPFLTPPRSEICESENQRATVICFTSTQNQTTANVYSLHEEREIRNWMMSPLYSPSLSNVSDEQQEGNDTISSKSPIETVGLTGVLSCLDELKLTTFTVFDIRNYYEARFDIGDKHKMYCRIYATLRKNVGIHFRKTNDKKWERLSLQTSSLPKEKTRSPAASGRLTPILQRRKWALSSKKTTPTRDNLEVSLSSPNQPVAENSLENLIRYCLNTKRSSHQIPVNYPPNQNSNMPEVNRSHFSPRPTASLQIPESTICTSQKSNSKPSSEETSENRESRVRSILIVLARIMRSKQMPRWQIINEILFLLPHLKEADSTWQIAVDYYLQRFCFKISTATSTEWSLPEAKYHEICYHLYNRK